MKYTNKLNLPFKLREDKDPVPHRYSVTELLSPSREIMLKRKYWNEIEIDMNDLVAALFGAAVHKMFEENTPEDKAEVKLEVDFGKDTIVGIMDYVDGDTIEDYKTATTSKVSKKDFGDYQDQVLAYALLRFIKYKVITRHGKIKILMKDWSKVKASKSTEYPQSPVFIYEFNIDDSDYDYIREKLIKKLSVINGSELPECTDEEKWYTGTTYAVYRKAGDKRAAYTTDSEEDAHNYITNKLEGAGEIEVRKGQYLKCDLYCSVSKFCRREVKE